MPYKDPNKRREMRARSRAAKKDGRAGSTSVGAPEVTALRSASDVLGLLERQVGAVLAAEGVDACTKARVVGFLAGIVLRASEAADLTARLDAIEQALAARDADTL